MLRKKIKLASTIIPNEIELLKSNANNKKSSNLAPTNQTNSPFFEKTEYWQKLYDIEHRMSNELNEVSFTSSAIAAVYNPIEYASELHCAYLKKFLNEPKQVLFIGMNPGPFGMVQTGVK